jgi:hypothetical protein
MDDKQIILRYSVVFIQSLRVNIAVVSKIGYDRFLAYLFYLVIHLLLLPDDAMQT